MLWVALLILTGLSFGSVEQCNPRIGLEEASRQASQLVGKVYSVSLSKNKKGECYYRVRGAEGSAVVDANDGKVLRFYRKRD
ncbi:curli assembly protein CsgG [Thermocrinis sp.]